MAFNHKVMRGTLKTVGISIFLVSLFFKLRSLMIHGGTRLEVEKEDEDENK